MLLDGFIVPLAFCPPIAYGNLINLININFKSINSCRSLVKMRNWIHFQVILKILEVIGASSYALLYRLKMKSWFKW